MTINFIHYLLLFVLAVLYTSTDGSLETLLCTSNVASLECHADSFKWVKIEGVVPDNGCGAIDACDEVTLQKIRSILTARCQNVSSCTVLRSHLDGPECAAKINYDCIQGARTTARALVTQSPREKEWAKNFGSWQWAIIWIVIAVVLVALIILIVMLINKFCYDALNQEKPKFIESTPTHSNLGSTLNSRSVSMSTLHRAPPIKKEVSQEEIDEVRAQFGTAKKNKDKNMKHFGVGINATTLDSRRSSGDGASGEANGKHYPGDDSSSGIGSVTYENRLKQGLYNDADTCHDDYISYTMKKHAKSPLGNSMGYYTLQTSKRVDENLYNAEAPTVDISEDRREEDFRLDINSWTLNRHGQQVPRGEPTGASTIIVDVEPSSPPSDIQLNPDPHH